MFIKKYIQQILLLIIQLKIKKQRLIKYILNKIKLYNISIQFLFIFDIYQFIFMVYQYKLIIIIKQYQNKLIMIEKTSNYNNFQKNKKKFHWRIQAKLFKRKFKIQFKIQKLLQQMQQFIILKKINIYIYKYLYTYIYNYQIKNKLTLIFNLCMFIIVYQSFQSYKNIKRKRQNLLNSLIYIRFLPFMLSKQQYKIYLINIFKQ
ncbi:hypothetical protein IMG5_098640 [Ichthyophthirius multifiliis]|uniref:Transmembrane protein n=1 Tax=Ichthyophthirius multifiliis TaxID=5932 RepID=G0QRZ8_ICHMU|nr:hypothetical protein IMG5_098640 [Ichthyophthirius multifiliis]EGR32028.1 hypothetical protein IMG5_098640 [Ichthyophthirius multifiliis]|eukprot:XP_004035514.1 hypothetical protein IMG5_098640 [Ichthyophthirius multifiliis]